MRKSRFTEEQMVAILREADRTTVAEAAKKHKVSEPTIYAWRKHFGQLEVADVKRLKALELENSRLKKLLAERDLDIEVLKEINAKKLVSPPARRAQVAFARERGLSLRRACGLVGMSRATPSYKPRMLAKDAPVIEAMKELSAQYPRYGYRRIRIFLRRRGFELSWSRTHRLWRQAGLLVPRKRSRKRITSKRPRVHMPFKANMVWAYDFVFDTTATGQQLKCLTVIDEYTRDCLAIDVAGSIRSKRVIEVLSRLVSVHGAPLFMRSDNGPEFVSMAILEWIAGAGIATVLNDPGKPWQNGTDESFNGKFRDECLSVEWFRSRREAKVVIESWRQHYNEVRPHSSLQYLTPTEFKLQLRQDPQPAVF
ncbi:IS3 family transposase [Roseateles amylovorans]|uniref:IS3 family transposase n=1 Tax=Roseateles amylovorans TaxID=2978473 RepID=A0ABY6B596_9BURK|nr:IS3 family transposase [Roseateles amylovorans]UXH80104.1 IS3 family transposase [Roseateles amylovorans]